MIGVLLSRAARAWIGPRHRRFSLLIGLLCVPVSLWCSSATADPTQFRGDPWPLRAIDNSSSGADGVRVADVNGDLLPDVTTGWEQGGVTRVYVHPGYASVRAPWPAVTVGLSPSAEDAVFGDLDGDGAMDVVSSCQGAARRVSVHWAPADPARYLDPAGWGTVILPASEGLMQWMYALPGQLDGRDGIDLVAGGKNENGQIGWFEAPADPRSADGWIWHPISVVGWTMSLIAADMDGDGDQDVVTSDRYGDLCGCRWLENPGPGPAQALPWTSHWIGAQGHEAMFMDLADLDQDGLEDAVAAAYDLGVVFMRRLDATGLHWAEYVIPYPENTGTPKAVAVGDLNRDARPDLVISCAHAEPPKSGVLWMAYGNSPFDAEWEDHEISGELGVKFDRLELLDLDGDGDTDVMTTEEVTGLGVIWYENPLQVPAMPVFVVY